MVVQLVKHMAQVKPENPFFILYASRSGSTFLANELTKRFKVLVTPEFDFITHALGQYGHVSFESEAQLDSLADTISSDPKFSDLNISHSTLRAMLGQLAPLTLSDAVRAILDHYRRACGVDGYYCGIKKGSYVYHYRDLLRLFPSAKFIGLIRDGRAVFHSQKHAIGSGGGGKPMAQDVKKAARRWVRLTRLMRELELDHPEVRIINYEVLIQHTSRTMSEIGEFLGVEPSDGDERLRQYEVPARYGDDLHRNIGKNPLAERISAWRKSLAANEIAQFEAVAGDCLVQEGYELVNANGSGSPWSRWLS